MSTLREQLDHATEIACRLIRGPEPRCGSPETNPEYPAHRESPCVRCGWSKDPLPKPALVWMTEHHRNCINGHHEADSSLKVVIHPVGTYAYVEEEFTREESSLSVCKHCRSVFPEIS